MARLVEEQGGSTSARAITNTGGAAGWTDPGASSSFSSSGSGSGSASASGSGSGLGLPGVGLRRGGLVLGPMSRCVLAQYLLPTLLRGVEADVLTPSSLSSTTGGGSGGGGGNNTTMSSSSSSTSSASSKGGGGGSESMSMPSGGGGGGVGNDRWGYLPQALQDACSRLQQQQQQSQQSSFGAASSKSTPSSAPCPAFGPGFSAGPGGGASPSPFGYRSLALVSYAGQRAACGGATGTEAATLALLCCRWLQVTLILFICS